MNRNVERFLASIPIIDFYYLLTRKIYEAFPITAYLSIRKKIFAQIEHVTYLPLGFLTGYLLGNLTLTLYLLILVLVAPLELLLMRSFGDRVPSWEWAKGKPYRFIVSVWGWSLLNASLYYLLGATISNIR